MYTRIFLYFTIFLLSLPAGAQGRIPYDAGAQLQALQRLQTLGSALYIAAHPDDENTRLITYLAQGRHLRTAYWSTTRGDGGQNLIGTEIGYQLGVIRTHELMAARALDGGEQFFSRANDFGYSKTFQETFQIWGRDDVLADLVWTIRVFRPDVLITRFAPEKYNYPTHGHHSASAILAEEAMKLAGDPAAYPDQLRYVAPWQPKRLYWNTSQWFYQATGTPMDTTGMLKLDAGGFNAYLGKSYGEIAGMSRSQHKSQGFGAPESKGIIEEYFEFVAGTPAKSDLYEDIETSWARVPGGGPIGSLLAEAYDKYDPRHPQKVLPLLLNARTMMLTQKDNHWVAHKLKELQDLVTGITGLYLEATANHYALPTGSPAEFTFTAVNRTGAALRLVKLNWPENATKGTDLPVTLADNVPYTTKASFTVPAKARVSQPYWLEKPLPHQGIYHVADQRLVGKPENDPPLTVEAVVEIEGMEFRYTVPVQYKWVDRVDGERFRPVAIVPPATINTDANVYPFANGAPRSITVAIHAWADSVRGKVKVSLPSGWQTNMPEITIDLKQNGLEQLVEIQVVPPSGASEGEIRFTLETAQGSFSYGHQVIDYKHIPAQMLFPPASARLVNLDIRLAGHEIGYIMGAGDEVPRHLEQIGYKVTPLVEGNIREQDLSKFDAILVGIRAFNTEKWLPARKPQLMAYVEQGGNLIVQYQTTWGLLLPEMGPYPFTIGRERASVEEAPITWLDPKDPMKLGPNSLGDADFEGWVQERGLYFAREWDERYRPVFSVQDPDEDPQQGMLVLASHGKGHFMYTGISFFRQLPAGVPGAYRLLANMISYGHRAP